jgi:hypothetical protein
MEENEMKEKHEHTWIYSYKSCCHVLKCYSCERATTVRMIRGKLPITGDEVRILEDGKTIEVIKGAKHVNF